MLVPHGRVQRFRALKQLVAAQRLLAALVAAQPRAGDRCFLPVDDEKPLLASPAVVLAWFAALAALAGQLPHFFLHDELHQLQSGLPHQVPDAVLQRRGDLLEGQRQLQ